jgi:hypothetical protein
VKLSRPRQYPRERFLDEILGVLLGAAQPPGRSIQAVDVPRQRLGIQGWHELV